MVKKLFCLLLCVVLPLTVFSGCDSSEDAYIYFELTAQPDTLDPQTAETDEELIIVKNIFEGLLRKDQDGNIVCAAAENYEKDGLVYTFKIRDDAVWSNGEKLTAYDFEYGFQRAVEPSTKAPFVSRLFSIKGAQEINSSKADVSTLGVKAVDDKTLQITLISEDTHFENTLTTSVAMPCNRVFFEDTSGKYGLLSETILCNGSYEITRWRKDPFGIRLYRNENYRGNFVSYNAAVFLTCDEDETPLQRLKKNSVDMAFIETAEKSEAENSGLTVKEFENICWVMTISNRFSYNVRKSFAMLVNGDIYSASLPEGYTVAASIYPSIFGDNSFINGTVVYNADAAKEIFSQEIVNFENGKFPSDVVLYYYDDGYVKNAVTNIVGHWQNNLSAFINIEAVSDSELLLSELTEPTYSFAIFPVSAESPEVAEYLKKFGVSYNGEELYDLQEKILKNINTIPLFFQNTNIAYSDSLDNVIFDYGNGYIDFSFLIKYE